MLLNFSALFQHPARAANEIFIQADQSFISTASSRTSSMIRSKYSEQLAIPSALSDLVLQ